MSPPSTRTMSLDAPSVDPAEMPPIPLKELEALVTRINEERFDGLPVGWAHPDNNCFARARTVATYFHTGEMPSGSRIDKIAGKLRNEPPKYAAAAKIQFSGGVRLDCAFRSGDPEVSSHLTPGTREIGWTNHEAAVVNTDQGVRVIDLAASKKPLKLEEWKALWMPENIRSEESCPFVDDSTFRETSVFWGMHGQFPNIERPEKLYCFRYAPAFDMNEDLVYVLKEDNHDLHNSTQYVQFEADDSSPYFDINRDKIPGVYVEVTSARTEKID